MPHELPKTYDPAAIEEKWAERWVQQDLWRQRDDSSARAKKPFTMLLPPPNVTGRLHMGHMLNQTEMDILARWHRMRGRPTLWVPGTDHAGIATQMMVERQLAGEGTSRQALGREGFIERVWSWREEYGGAILGQMKRLGASVDWSREYFTMDDNLSLAVREAFLRLHEQGLIYRGKYIVNWDPVQQTAVSDLEVTHEERMGKLYHVRYPLADGTGSVTIATTRPETMLGDVAVAVNPDDERYASLVGRILRLPLSAREIPVIADAWANPEFGTGAVKVTPAHDPNDFAIGTRHNLPQLTIMDAEARIDLPGSPYHGLDRYAARERIVDDLRTAGLLVEVKDHAMAIGLSQRTGAVIEPRLSTQWFLRTADFTNEAGEKCEGLARKAIEAVEQGHITFTPEQYRKTYMQWMENIHDWCISRQLWWGHRIPAWHCAACTKDTVARETPVVCAQCGSTEIEQESDVLDTWFSSGLLPFTVFGWPQLTPELKTLYPTSLLVTGSDILFFWVARMVMFGCWFMGDDPKGPKLSLAESVPFEEVYIHALVRDAERQKMSKTKGNVLDPIQVVNQYGTDAVRFTLASMASPGTDIAFNEQRTEGYRAFANKIWNAARFIFMNVERAKDAGAVVDMHALADAEQSGEIEARWIRSTFEKTVGAVNDELEDYRFDNAAMFVYRFFWGEFCDWYLEIVKLRLVFDAESDNTAATAALSTLLSIFESSLRLLSPFMPFLTEELWQALHDGATGSQSIGLAEYPKALDIDHHGTVLHDMSLLQELITAVRALRKDLAMPEKQPAAIVVHAGVAFDASAHALVLQKLAFAPTVSSGAFDPSLAQRTTANFEVQVLFVRTIDPEAEAARLNKEMAGLRKAMEAAERQLGNAGFLSKAPANVVEGLEAQHAENTSLLAKKQSELDALGSAK
jgi:valyl-tRNA synthetase